MELLLLNINKANQLGESYSRNTKTLFVTSLLSMVTNI